MPPPPASPLTTPSENLYATLQAVPTSETGETATIENPMTGSKIFTGTLRISGWVENLAQDEFTLSIVGPDGSVINTQPIHLMNPNHVAKVPWSAAMTITRYVGDALIEVHTRSATGEDILLARAPVTIQQGGSGSVGGNANDCAPLASPNDSCTQCMPEQCAATAAACTGSACTCGDYGGYKGQMNCLLACATLSPMMSAADVMTDAVALRPSIVASAFRPVRS